MWSDMFNSIHVQVSLHLYPELELDVEPEDRETPQEDAEIKKWVVLWFVLFAIY